MSGLQKDNRLPLNSESLPPLKWVLVCPVTTSEFILDRVEVVRVERSTIVQSLVPFVFCQF